MNLDASGALDVSSLDQGFIGENGAIINDNAAPWLIKEIIPVGLKGLILAALAADNCFIACIDGKFNINNFYNGYL